MALDGCVGCGKTTTLRLMEADVLVLPEPAQRVPADAAFERCSRVVRDRVLSKLAVQVGQSKTAWACMERSPDMHRRMLHTQGLDPEHRHALEASYETGALLWRPAGIIYIRVPPETLFERTRQREDATTVAWHQEMHAAHEAAIADIIAEGTVVVRCIDAADMTKEEVAASVLRAYKTMYVC